jgi:hypothetical protein
MGAEHLPHGVDDPRQQGVARAAQHLAQQLDAVCILERHVGIWEERADVSLADRAENGDHDGMREGVRIRVPKKPALAWDLYPAEHTSPPCLEGMDVYSLAYPNLHDFACWTK